MAFYHAVDQLLFSCPRAQKDVQTTFSFLTIRVRSPDKDDWVNLKRVLQYVRQKINLPLILRADRLTFIEWWFDASYAAHTYMRGHTGANISLRRGSVTGMDSEEPHNQRQNLDRGIINQSGM